MTIQLTPSRQALAASRMVPMPLSTVGIDVDAEAGLAALQAIGAIARFDRNETIFSEGDAAIASFRVVSGGVRLCKVLADGRRQIAEFRLAGDFFGLDGDGEYALTAEALSDTVVVRYARTRMDRLENEQESVRKDLMTILRRDLTTAQAHLIMLGRQTAKERVASFLVQLADRRHTANGGQIEIPMGRQDIADYLGLTIETVCRTISELKRMRIVSVPDRHHIVVRNIEALQAMADGDD